MTILRIVTGGVLAAAFLTGAALAQDLEKLAVFPGPTFRENLAGVDAAKST